MILYIFSYRNIYQKIESDDLPLNLFNLKQKQKQKDY
jgi:hypothetical protein